MRYPLHSDGILAWWLSWMIGYSHAWVINVPRLWFMMLPVQAYHSKSWLIEFFLIWWIVTFRCRILNRINEPSNAWWILHTQKNMSAPPQTHPSHSQVPQRSSCNIAPTENPMSPMTTPNINESDEFRTLRWKYAEKLTTIKEMFLAWSGEDILSLLGKVNEVNGSLEVAVMCISKGEFLALIFVLWENHTMLIHVLVPQICHEPCRVVSHITLLWHILDPYQVRLWKSLLWLPPNMYINSHTKETYFP